MNDTAMQSMHLAVYARPPGVLGGIPLLAGFNEGQRVAILLGLSVVGVFFARSPRGRFVVATSLLGAILPRARREALLDHFVRGRIFQVISENPGIHFSELRRKTGIGNGAALYHLGVLEKGGIIRVVVDGPKTRFFPTDQPFDRASYGLTPLDQAVVDAVTLSPGIFQKDLSRSLGKSPSSVSRTVRRLVGFGFLSTTRSGRDVALFPRDAPGAAPEESA